MAKKQFTPLQTGKLCPFISMEWEDWKRKWDCQDPEFYHCIPDQYNRPGQICIKPNWASKNYCPIFNTAANDIDLIPCDLQYGACSDKDYRSNKVYQYAGCLNNTHQKIQETSTLDSVVIESPIQPHIIILAVAVPVVLLMVTIGVVFYCCRRKGAKNDANDIELQPLIHQNTVPWRFLKAINYLENKVFYPTETYKLAIGTLAQFHHITLIGPPGSGKTFMAVQLARQQCGKKEKSQMCFGKTLQEIKTLSESKDECMNIIMDDWLDHYAYYPSKVTEDIKLFDDIEDVIKYKKVRLIFTVQKDKWQACNHHFLKHKLFCSESCVLIEDKEFSKKEIQHMVTNHLKYHETMESSINTQKNPEEETSANKKMDVLSEKIKQVIEKDLKSDKEFSLPVMIDLICANTSLIPSRNLFLKDGFSKILRSFLQDWLNDKSIDEKNSLCIFLFAALRGGKITIADFTSAVVGPIYKNVCKEYGSECIEDIESIEGMLMQNRRLKGCLYQENDVFVFRHESVLCFVLQFLIETKHSKFLIKNVDMEILLQRCWLKETILKIFNDSLKGIMSSESVGAVIIPKDALKDLAKRIHEERLKGYFIPDWPEHVFMGHKMFRKTWEEASPDTMMENQPKGWKSQEKITNESTINSGNGETTQDTEKGAHSNVTGDELYLNGGENNDKQSKHSISKDKDKASNDGTDSNSKKTDFKKETKPNSEEPSQHKKISPDPTEENDPDQNEPAEKSKQSKHNVKKTDDKVPLVNNNGKSKKQGCKETEESNVETSQQNTCLDQTEGGTPV